MFYDTRIGSVQTDFCRDTCAVPIFTPPFCTHASNVTATDDSWCHAIASRHGIMRRACSVASGFVFVAFKSVFKRQAVCLDNGEEDGHLPLVKFKKHSEGNKAKDHA